MKMKIIYILFVSILLQGCTNSNSRNKTIEDKFTLTDSMLKTTETVSADIQNVRNELRFYGKITADNNKLVEVYPVVGGNVLKVYTELGDYVQKDQILATIRSTEVAGFEKELMDAKTDVLVCENNVKVAEEMYQGKLIAERDVLEAKSLLEKAKSQLLRTQETFKIYNLKTGSVYEVRSPISGFIIQKNINQDMQLRSDRSDNIFDIAQIDDVWAIANVNESDIGTIKLGMGADIKTLSYPDKDFKGKVDKIFNVIDPETKAMKVMIRLNNSDFLLKPEMIATIRISYEEPEKMIAIPAKSIIFDKSKNFVMVYKSKDDFETRNIEIYRQVGEIAFVKSGLSVGDKIITRNQLLIYDALND
jgi:cobalt-zinc-cadmium efflux system membrane fusion protein